MKLGPIAEWGLNLEKKTIPVNTENFQTNKEGIFAIGDICAYPGKLKLILSGFHEGSIAARACFKLARPNEKYRFEFSTTSKSMQDRLGLKKMIELFYADTPNGRKISIMLEEIQFDYKITTVKLLEGDQFKSKFRSISPLSKIPAITDHKNKVKFISIRSYFNLFSRD